jgi:rod shape-determining protein MreC
VAILKRRRLAVSGLVVASVLLGVFQFTGGVMSGLRSTGNVIVSPFAWAIELVARPVGHLATGALNYSEMVAQNKQLRYQLGEAQLKANESASIDRQLRQLAATLDVPYVNDLPTITAQVNEQSPTNFIASIGISKGTHEGVLVGMPVVGSGGLIGRVVATTLHGATIQLVTDAASSIGCTFGDGQLNAIVSGRGLNHPLSVSAIPLKATLTPGTVFATNGLQGGLFPAGLPVAQVSGVTLTPGATTYDLKLKPLADLRHLSYVTVIAWEPGT